MKYEDFYDDVEKMRDFKVLSKEDFLKSYSYITAEEYDLTRMRVSASGYPDLSEHYLLILGEVDDYIIKYVGKIEDGELRDAIDKELERSATFKVKSEEKSTYYEPEAISNVMDTFTGIAWEFVNYTKHKFY